MYNRYMKTFDEKLLQYYDLIKKEKNSLVTKILEYLEYLNEI